MWKLTAGRVIDVSIAPEDCDDWEMDPNLAHDVNEQQQRRSLKMMVGLPLSALTVDIQQLPEETSREDKAKKLMEHKGHFIVEKDRIDKSAQRQDRVIDVSIPPENCDDCEMDPDFAQDVNEQKERWSSKSMTGLPLCAAGVAVQQLPEDKSVQWQDCIKRMVKKHASQKDYSTEFEGKFGVQSNKRAAMWEPKQKHASREDYSTGLVDEIGMQANWVEKSGVSLDYDEKVEKHELQKDYSRGFGGKFEMEADRHGKAVDGCDHIKKLQKHENQLEHKVVRQRTLEKRGSRNLSYDLSELQMHYSFHHSTVQKVEQLTQLTLDQPLDLCTHGTESTSYVTYMPSTAVPKDVFLKTSDASSKQSKKPSKPYIRTYAETSLATAVDKIRDSAMPLSKASKTYGVPRTTLQYRLSTEYKNKGSRGPYTVFSADEETRIVKWLKDMERKGYPITQNSLRFKVCSFLNSNPRQTPFSNNTPGKSWFKLFMKRHPDLSIRTPEAVTAASSKVTEKDLRNWFRNVYNYLEDNKLTNVLLDPARILNGDETGFSLNPVPKQVIAVKGKKNISFVETTSSKQNITVMFSFSADGTVLPPDVILNQKRPSREVLRAFPGNWGIGTSENGWMNTANFVSYIKKILYPALKKKGTKFPVLYFVDGHSSHMAFQAADACAELGIIMIALYPNATRILQPTDVAIFGPLKNSWGKIVDLWRAEHPSEKLTLTTFGPLLEQAMETSFTKRTIVNGFEVCGLYPFNANAVDYSKCLGKSAADDITNDADGNSNADNLLPDPVMPSFTTNNVDEEGSAENSLFKRSVVIPVDVMATAIKTIGSSKITMYLSDNSDSMSHEDQALSYIYKNILILGGASPNDDFEQDNACTRVECHHEFTSGICQDDTNEDVVHPFENDPQNAPQAAGEFEEDPENETAPLFGIECQGFPQFPDEFNEDEIETVPVTENNFHDDLQVPTVFEKDFQASGSMTPKDNKTLLRDSTNKITASDGRSSMAAFFVSPPTPKRNPKHRNYANRANIVLTAAERLEELRILEERKLEAVELKKKRAEVREIRKQEKEKLAVERKVKKIEREEAKQVAIQLKNENARKRKQEKERKLAEKCTKKQKLLL